LDLQLIDNLLKDFIHQVPKLDLSFIKRLTTSTGIIQHASFNIPNYHHGYCLDDNARALLLLCMANNTKELETDTALISCYLAYIHYAQNSDGSFRNFMSYDLNFLDKQGSDDSLGRTIWALGTVLASDTLFAFHKITQEIFNKALPHLTELKSPRAVAYAILGLVNYLESHPDDEHVLGEISTLCHFLALEFKVCADEEWPWFEEIISYDNAILPLAMLKTARILNNEEWLNIGLKSFTFLDQILYRKEYISTIGNQSWHAKSKDISEYGQQPVEIPSILLLYQEMEKISPSITWQSKIKLAFLWYLGWNDKQLSLYNPIDKSCYDGLEDYGVNQNQGAESNIAFWMSYLLIKSNIST